MHVCRSFKDSVERNLSHFRLSTFRSPIELNRLFASSEDSDFERLALEVCAFQRAHNAVYARWCALLGTPERVERFEDIPFLPISFFKTHRVASFEGEPQLRFESSGTSGSANSVHGVFEPEWYRASLLKGFESVFGDPARWAIVALLPHYLERGASSLVWMCRELMEASGVEGGFFLGDWDALNARLQELESSMDRRPMLIGAAYALLDWAETVRMPLSRTLIVETGGMKGRGRELVREELHLRLGEALGLGSIASEYGMTEMFSQAWSLGSGIFQTPPWLKFLVRDPRDPLDSGRKQGRGCLNVVDLANVYSCSFLATDDLVRISENGEIFVEGRRDGSDLRGCNLLTFSA